MGAWTHVQEYVADCRELVSSDSESAIRDSSEEFFLEQAAQGSFRSEFEEYMGPFPLSVSK